MHCNILVFQKPIRKKKKYIDPKNERTKTFAIIHRSQKDPLAADDEAPQRLLQVIRESVPDGDDNNKESKQETRKLKKDQKEEERQFGVFYDDEYNYMQHLKDREVQEKDWSEMDQFLLEAPKGTKSSDQTHGRSENTRQQLSETSKKV